MNVNGSNYLERCYNHAQRIAPKLARLTGAFVIAQIARKVFLKARCQDVAYLPRFGVVVVLTTGLAYTALRYISKQVRPSRHSSSTVQEPAEDPNHLERTEFSEDIPSPQEDDNKEELDT